MDKPVSRPEQNNNYQMRTSVVEILLQACRRFIWLAILSAAFINGLKSQSRVTLREALRPFLQTGDLPKYGSNTHVAQVSSYDTTAAGNDDGFSGRFSFIRRNPDSSLVLFDVDGPGVIERIWTPTPTTDTLDFYMDHAQTPTFSVCYIDLFSGNVFPFTRPLCDQAAGGYYCYFPISFQRHCTIVCRGKQLQFHQFQYRIFEKDQKVKSFTGSLSRKETNLLNGIGKSWSGVNDSKNAYHKKEVKFTLGPETTIPIFEMTKGGRIMRLELDVKEFCEQPDSNVLLRIFWDNESSPAVECLLNEFFGFAFGKPAMKGLLMGCDQGKMYCLLPMPFDKAARIELVNKGSSNITFDAIVHYSSERRKVSEEGKLYVERKKDWPRKGEQQVLLKIEGKGHYIGTILTAQGAHSGTLFFEGDDSTSVDGRFSIHGTGSEDYFNGGWYAVTGRWDSIRSKPLSGCLGYNSDAGQTGGYRFYLSDKISFTKSICQGIEHGYDPRNTVAALYTTLAFYYCDRPKNLQ